MRILIFSGSRSDLSGLEHVHGALNERGHEAHLLRLQIEHPKSTAAAVSISQHALSATAEAAGEGFDWALLGGDRYETLASALACSIVGLRIAHLAGGDVTSGSRDDYYRDAISALADLHLATNRWAATRLCDRFGIEPVELTGSPALDRLLSIETGGRQAICDKLGVRNQALAIVCVHPNTLKRGDERVMDYVETMAALTYLQYDFSIVWLGANADVGGAAINASARKRLEDFPDAVFHAHISVEDMATLMTNASVMVGNSSAGIIEAPSFGLPVVNVGNRQEGRMRADNVYDCEASASVIVETIRRAMRQGRYYGTNPYGDGKATEKIIEALERHGRA